MKKFILILIPFSIFSSLTGAQNPTLWGMTLDGGINPPGKSGTLFRFDIATGKETVMHNFGSGNDGHLPYGSLIQASNGLLYGMTSEGGAYDSALRGGIIFNYDIARGNYNDLHDFGNGKDGYFPQGSLIQANNGLLYGMTSSGGAYDTAFYSAGIIFSYDISTATETDLHDFGSGTDGFFPYGSLIQATDGLLYGMTSAGGIDGDGLIFSYDISTGSYTDLHDFGSGSDGQEPLGSFIQANDGLLYGTTLHGGIDDAGTIFSYDISTGSYSDVHDFGNGTGREPAGSLVQASNGLLYGTTDEGGMEDRGIIFSYNISTGKETSIFHFSFPAGQNPEGSLIDGSNGLLYGTTAYGGTDNIGTLFSYDITKRNETEVLDFASDTNGSYPYGDLLEIDDTFATGLNPLVKSIDNIQLYPNPSSSVVNLSLKLQQGQNINLSLFNTLGQQVWREDLVKTKQIETTIPVMNLANGVYLLKVSSGGSWQEKEVTVTR